MTFSEHATPHNPRADGRLQLSSRSLSQRFRVSRISALAASVSVAMWIVLIDNRAFWRTFWSGQGEQNAQTAGSTTIPAAKECVPGCPLSRLTSGVKDGTKNLCSEGACLDEILVSALKDRLSGVEGDTAIVLHQIGSHGPFYNRRYPAPGRFQTTCDSNRIQTCDRGVLVNTYDNLIDYTSQVIARAINAAGAHANQMDVAVVYLSDHGESLGERNIYLHGLPLLLAPGEQTRVPMLAWLSEGAQGRLGLPLDCLASISEKPFFHDNLFPSLLGFFGVTFEAYRPDLDIWAAARAAGKCAKAA